MQPSKQAEQGKVERSVSYLVPIKNYLYIDHWKQNTMEFYKIGFIITLL